MLTSIGLFAGIGGIEEGFRRCGHTPILLCEIDPHARAILKKHFDGVPLEDDIRSLRSLPRSDVVAAGFPCQDLSQAGRTKGINGRNSSLIHELFRLIRRSRPRPTWLVIENVPFMLSLSKGLGMSLIIGEIEDLGYRWAYRVIDTRAFGFPQRRRRVFIVASRKEDPREVILSEDAGKRDFSNDGETLHGFYWTEGLTGLGWAIDAVPTLKGGSSVSIPSPPGIWLPQKRLLATPDIRDAERLQGFRPNWTVSSNGDIGSDRKRWKLVGNAVSVPIMKWLGSKLVAPTPYDWSRDERIVLKKGWPTAAWGHKGKLFRSQVSEWAVRKRYRGLSTFLEYPITSLSWRATNGFYSRAQRSRLRFEQRFIDDVKHHLTQMQNTNGKEQAKRY